MKLGIIFTGGEGPAPEKAAALACGADLVVAADAGLLAANAAGIKPDFVLGDFDSLGDQSLLAPFAAEQILRFPADKDFTDTELAVSFARGKGCGRVWLLGGGGGRTDHLFAIRALFERESPPERWFTGSEEILCLSCGGLPEIQRTSGGPISVFPLGAGPWQAESAGLQWPLDSLEWNRGFFGLSNRAEGAFRIRALAGRFLVVLGID